MLEQANLRYKPIKISSRTAYLHHASMPFKSSSHHHSAFKIKNFFPKLQNSQLKLNIISDRQSQSSPPKKAGETSEIPFYYRSQPRDCVNRTKFSFHGLNSNTTFSSDRYQAISKQGKRPYNEDRYICHPKILSPFLLQRKQNRQNYELYAVFDGHGGYKCADFLKQNLSMLITRSHQLEANPEEALKQAFFKAEEKFLTVCQNIEPPQTSGACAVVCLIREGKIHIAHLGDCRGLLLSKQSFLVLTQDHKPDDRLEKIRILKNGGKIYREQEGVLNQIKIFRQARILPGNLNVSRTFGDIQVKLKKYGGLPGIVSSTPDVATFSIFPFTFLLLASDGLFQAFTPEEIHTKFVHSMKDEQFSGFAEKLAEQAEQKSRDNITIVTVALQ